MTGEESDILGPPCLTGENLITWVQLLLTGKQLITWVQPLLTGENPDNLGPATSNW